MNIKIFIVCYPACSSEMKEDFRPKLNSGPAIPLCTVTYKYLTPLVSIKIVEEALKLLYATVCQGERDCFE